ncbi:acetyl/propionyl/methylcrotonyl-CoA carboxylase subunit alpha [Kibdelosporangium aridum]|uniref:Biotin-dependent 3-methylcrotonyl-coenzyme A carboxylase alpha1 subunit n=1 Tax=Kibdelosporangium aridum TaxID=2030 RepID=A0A428XTP4_KIBAR|nr:acetyl/propionyl/methylcrotonyl-CoA carboxylase subunit alpha [Kibdelosporangium aridum]RSM58711.1 acetyl/propionyl/methylcrotonyl-CoA carboxylase subunit alpha [Kibdelosporangium aridum]
MFQRVLIANRGEIAVRITRTLARMGVRSIAVYSDADADARHVLEADTAVRIGPAAARDSYLSIPRIIEAALSTGAEAIHPGYGFLAENVDFARACADAGLVFVGPPVAAIEAMGDKIRAKQTVMAAGVPVVPGRTEPGMTDEDLVSAASEIGFPVLLKPSAGGGGKGMRLVTDSSDLAPAIESARREALGSFGDDTLLIERFVQRPRHIEIQVLADTYGNVIHLGERECSLQRRHQKIIEEAPSPLLTPEMRARMGASAVDAARAVGYTGAGTVECIVSADRPDEFFFMEMNTRLQVEHPVTELVTGLDLVEWQLRVAAGEPLTMSSVSLNGHAIEARIYAEDPARDFLPTGGTVLDVVEPAGARVDSGLRPGTEVGSNYDPMLAKIIVSDQTREAALTKLSAALADTAVLGVGTNIAYLRDLLADPDVVAGRLDTQLVSRRSAFTQSTPDHVFAVAAMDELLTLQPVGPVVDPWDIPSGWRVGGAAGFSVRLDSGDRQVTVCVRDSSVSVDGGAFVPASASVDGSVLRLTFDGRTHRYRRAKSGSVLWLAFEGFTWAIAEHSLLEESAVSGAEGGPITSPMPGTVLVVKAAVGDRVAAGTPLLVVEAMKMEHTIAAPVDGVLTELHVQAGQQVALNQPLALVTPEEQT